MHLALVSVLHRESYSILNSTTLRMLNVAYLLGLIPLTLTFKGLGNRGRVQVRMAVVDRLPKFDEVRLEDRHLEVDA